MKLYDVYGHGLLIFPIVGFVYNISFKWSLLSWSSTLRNGDHLICRSFFFEALQSWPTTIPQMSDALVGWVKTSIYRLRWLGPHSTNQYEAHFIRVPNRQSAFFFYLWGCGVSPHLPWPSMLHPWAGTTCHAPMNCGILWNHIWRK
jgi:hypothetical protein